MSSNEQGTNIRIHELLGSNVRLAEMHEATINEDPCTNNVSEAWNNKFAHMVGRQHPTVWKCIEALQLEEQPLQSLIKNRVSRKINK